MTQAAAGFSKHTLMKLGRDRTGGDVHFNARRELQTPIAYVELGKVKLRLYINSCALQGWASAYMAVH